MRSRFSALDQRKEQQTRFARSNCHPRLTALNDQWHQEFKLIKQQLDLINKQETALQIEVEYKGDKAAFLKYMKDLFRGSKLRETTLGELVNTFADGAGIYRELDKAKA